MNLQVTGSLHPEAGLHQSLGQSHLLRHRLPYQGYPQVCLQSGPKYPTGQSINKSLDIRGAQKCLKSQRIGIIHIKQALILLLHPTDTSAIFEMIIGTTN